MSWMVENEYIATLKATNINLAVFLVPFPFLSYKIVVHHLRRESLSSKLFMIAYYCRPIFIHFVAAVSMPGANLGLPSDAELLIRIDLHALAPYST